MNYIIGFILIILNIKNTMKVSFFLILSMLFLVSDVASAQEGAKKAKKKTKAPKAQANRCALEPDPGTCRAAIPRFYFDKKENQCKEFIWGGCGGVVPFETLEACKKCSEKK
jgi:hypothetical protein